MLKTETNRSVAGEKSNEGAKDEREMRNGDAKEQNTFSAQIGETTFPIPIFSEEFLNYNRSTSLLTSHVDFSACPNPNWSSPAIFVYIWSNNFSHSASSKKSETKMADIDVQHQRSP